MYFFPIPIDSEVVFEKKKSNEDIDMNPLF